MEYEVNLYFTTFVTKSVTAESEEDAIERARAKVTFGETDFSCNLSPAPDLDTAQRASDEIRVGDFVRVMTNAKGTAWEDGKVMKIFPDGALIGYGGKNLPNHLRIYGCAVHEPLRNLEKIT